MTKPKVQHPITYVGIRRVTAKKWVHVGFDEATKTLVPMPEQMIPVRPRPKAP